MEKSRFTEAQITGMIEEQEAWMPTAEVCRYYGLIEGSLYKWWATYGDMTISELRRLKYLANDNAELKQLLFDTILDEAGLESLLAKNP